MRQRPKNRRAFTLVELMVVIVIIIILVSILAPSVSKAIQMSYLAKTRSQIQNLERGIEAFRYVNNHYPGQTDRTGKARITSTPLDTRGSEFLTRILWTTLDPETTAFSTTALTSANAPKTTDYSAFDNSMWFGTSHKTDKYNNAVSDGFSKEPMPILYFAADLTKNDDQQYRNASTAAMNNAYTSGNIGKGTFADLFTRPGIKENLWPRLKDRYLLIAPGLDRKYFQTTDSADKATLLANESNKTDDITN